MTTVTSSFSKAPFFKMFPTHTKKQKANVFKLLRLEVVTVEIELRFQRSVRGLKH